MGISAILLGVIGLPQSYVVSGALIAPWKPHAVIVNLNLSLAV